MARKEDCPKIENPQPHNIWTTCTLGFRKTIYIHFFSIIMQREGTRVLVYAKKSGVLRHYVNVNGR